MSFLKDIFYFSKFSIMKNDNKCNYCNHILIERVDNNEDWNATSYYICNNTRCDNYNKEHIL